jgi:spore coat protein H
MKIQSFTGKKPGIIIALKLLFLCLSVVSVHAQATGDVNTDGAINIVDALLVARYYVGLDVPDFNTVYADVDGNGSVQITDALLIARYYVGLITSFPGEPAVTPTPVPGGTDPRAAFTISTIVPGVNEAVTFDASGSIDPDGTIVSYLWDFDDGNTTTGVRVTHSFGEMDDFKVTLTVTDNNGLTDDITQRVFVGRPEGWTQETHHKSADANYDLLFPENSVPRIDIIIDPVDFQTMENNVNTLNIMSTEDPVYVPVTVQFNGYTWWHAGLRYKGQSTLFIPRQSGKKKLPFRLNMDKFEDDFPEIDNQRFYGFDEMTFANNWFDPSFLRDRLCGDIFRAGGIPAARGGFCRIFIDTGSGPVYWGLYSMIEDPSDQMLTYQFEDDGGNLYKPEGQGAEFSTFVREAYVKKTNEDEEDYSDVQALISALNAPRTDAAAWRAGLETVFNIEEFLRWLAINTGIVNFDTYGWVTKNYYVYQDLADNGRLVWIPWDLNLSLSMTNPWNVRIPSLSLDEITSQWPLIRYVMDDPVYRNFYHQEMGIAMDGCFNEADVTAKIRQYAELIRPYVVGAEGESREYSYLTNGAAEFDDAVTSLLNHVSSRRITVRDYLNSR